MNNYQKYAADLVLTIVLLTAALVPKTAHAAPLPSEVIDGTITNYGPPPPAPGFNISIFCNGRYIAGESPDEHGFYQLRTTSALCAYGSTIWVNVYKNGSPVVEGNGTGVASAHTIVDIAVGKNVVVPEFGWASAAVAAGVGLCGIALVRKRGLAHGQ